jgi:hypothetical protein
VKVKEAIKIFSTMNPDDELVMVVWDKETMAGYIDNEEHLLTDSVWKQVASEFEIGALDLPIGNELRKALDESMRADKEDLLAYTKSLIEEEHLWDTGEKNDN